MDYSIFLMLREELSLLALILILLVYDIFGSAGSRRYFQTVACVLFALQTVFNLFPTPEGNVFGGMYHNSLIISLVKTILNLGTLIIFLQSGKWLENKDMQIRKGEFYVLVLCTLLGMYLMISAGNLLIFFIGMETASLPVAALIAFEKFKHNSYEAAAKYIFTAVFSTGIMLYGLSLVYGAAGTLYFEDLPARIDGNPLQILAFVFFISGIGFKISMVPFHLWTADVYEGAPTQITSYLSVISKAAGVFALMVILFKVFGPMVVLWQYILYGLIIATIVIGNLFAIRQQNLKRFLAFSSISQVGYILLGIISGTAIGMTSVVFYILVYMFSNLAAFGVISEVERQTGQLTISSYNGLYQTNPRLSLVMMLSMFSLAGIPPLAGFFSKFFIFAAAAREGYYLLVLIALINTIISLYYYLLVVKAMFLNKQETPIAYFRSDKGTCLSLVICVISIVMLGFVSVIYEHISTLSFGIL